MTTFILAILSPAWATNTITDCSAGDAPSSHHNESCIINSTSVCHFGPGFTQTTMYCNTSAFDRVIDARVIYNYYDGSGYSGVTAAYGDLDDGGTTESFCCRLNDNDSITTRLVFSGTDGNDFINFWESDINGPHDLQSHLGTTAFKAIAYGGDGNDTIQGSYDQSAYYSEYIYGEAGDDTLNGFTGDDYLQGGPGDDTLHGYGGDDQLWGNNGADELTGGADSDCVIDKETCPDVAGNDLYGSGENDFLWVGFDGASCATSFSVDGGAGTDRCGDDAWASGYSGNFTSCTLNIATFTDFQTDSGCTVPSP